MIYEYIKPIKEGYELTLIDASKYLKEVKRGVIVKAVEQVTGKVYKLSQLKDRIDYKYTDIYGNHIFMLDGEELIHFYPSSFKQNEKNEITCSFEYKLLYEEGV